MPCLNGMSILYMYIIVYNYLASNKVEINEVQLITVVRERGS